MRNSIFATIVAMTGCVLAATAHGAPAKAWTVNTGNSYGDLFAYCLGQANGQMNWCHAWTRCMTNWQLFEGDLSWSHTCSMDANSYVSFGWQMYD